MRRVMPSITALLLALTLSTPTRAETPKLTPAEASAGWLLLFDGETDFGWKPRGDAKWSVKNGEITVEPGAKGYLATTTEFADFELKADVWIDDKANSGIFLRCPTEGDIDSGKAYEVNVYDAHDKWPTGSINEHEAARAKVKSAGKWTSFIITAEGDHLVVNAGGKKMADVHDKKHTRGMVALQYNGEGEVKFRNIRLRPLKLESIFNGKDLTGWTPVPERPSVYSVTPEGWLNVKNGPGDIQTSRAWGDFVLQLDIISNGEHLNSGVFFRANPGKSWSGYEAQIRNEWRGDRDHPFDFGTGGIYNRQAARKVVSSDHEWFTMTVVAAGKHLSTWVNGYQVTDFTDQRREDQTNARVGARTEPGVLSIQGHDRTTDLSFKNIRVAELPK